LSNLFSALADFGDATAVVADNGARLSYRELANHADESVRDLDQRRMVVAVECDNSIASLCAYLGAERMHHAVLLIDASLPEPSRKKVFERYRIPAVWRAAQRGWERIEDAQSGPSLHPDLALLLSTSGSTGSPKLVRLSLRNVQSNALSIAQYLELTSSERPITSLPMHYTYGLSVVHSHLLVGATLLLTRHPVSARPFWDFFRAESGTSFSGVPTMYEILRRLHFESMELPSLRSMTQAGGRLAPDTVSHFSSLAAGRGQRFWVMYGQAEATARMAYLPPEYAAAKPASIGRPVPGGSFKLVDAEGNAVAAPRAEGELVYAGPNVMMGYAESAEDLAGADDLNGELHTGDMAWRDEDGFFYISGRLKRFIKVFGNRISLDEVECYAKESGLHAAATGKDDLMLLAVISPPRAPHEIRAELSRQYRLHHSAVRVVEVPEFPLSSSGKIQYSLLLNELLSSTQSP